MSGWHASRTSSTLRSSSARARRSAKAREESTMPQQKRPNMQQMLQQVQKMQRDMEQAQEALKHETVEAAAGGGVVKVQVSGDLQVRSVTIAPEAADPEDVEMLGDLVL